MKNNQLSSELTGARTNATDGADICYESTETAEGTLTLRPEEGEEQSMVILSIDYLTGMEFKGGTLTIHVPTGFEITDNASVTIEGQSAVNASVYNLTEQMIDITGIDLESGTVTLTLEEQQIPD